ncbi:hypothetical protein [Paenibacillus senegalimassiliensis]|uniref:hypothetical protein n=1 Tax=Paenibacillus senegalimassiliensis TaxID=1737426 RepID=UPI00165296DF|nr:hypothetical protein [Paenibacillus senegalimassiliensis]
MKDEDEKPQVKLFLQKLIRQAETDVAYAQLVELIFQALEFLEKRGLSHSIREFFTTSIRSDSLYSIRVVKELENHPPLLEFRVNWRGVGAFRAIFFRYMDDDVEVLVFTQAVLKNASFSLAFEQIVKVSEKQYLAFIKSPEKYILTEGDDLDE